jgi:hypothetical protein
LVAQHPRQIAADPIGQRAFFEGHAQWPADGLQGLRDGRDGGGTLLLPEQLTRFGDHSDLRELAMNVEADVVLVAHFGAP